MTQTEVSAKPTLELGTWRTLHSLQAVPQVGVRPFQAAQLV